MTGRGRARFLKHCAAHTDPVRPALFSLLSLTCGSAADAAATKAREARASLNIGVGEEEEGWCVCEREGVGDGEREKMKTRRRARRGTWRVAPAHGSRSYATPPRTPPSRPLRVLLMRQRRREVAGGRAGEAAPDSGAVVLSRRRQNFERRGAPSLSPFRGKLSAEIASTPSLFWRRCNWHRYELPRRGQAGVEDGVAARRRSFFHQHSVSRAAERKRCAPCAPITRAAPSAGGFPPSPAWAVMSPTKGDWACK